MDIKSGGQTERMGAKKLESIKISKNSSSRSIELQLNDSSLSYLTIDEALNLRDELQMAINECVK